METVSEQIITRSEILPIRTQIDLVHVRQRVRTWLSEERFTLIDQTKIVTAASELARNALEHGGGGEMEMSLLAVGARKGIRLKFSDQGPGIADVAMALRDGYTTAGGMGLGLSGSRRLMSEFDIQSSPGSGTVVTVTRWK